MEPVTWPYYDGSITLADWMGSDLTVVNAARVSFGQASQEFTGKDRKLIRYLAEHKHMSPFRHVQLQFVCKDIPEVIARQWFKHQVGCGYTSGDFREPATVWNEISGRYVELPTEFFQPASFRKQSKDNKQASLPNDLIEKQDEARGWYEQALRQAEASYKAMLELGVCKEQARMVLPMAFKTSFIWTTSLEGAVNFVRLRKHPGAQGEMLPAADAVDAAIRLVAPVSVAALLGESCSSAQD